ncbi:hypothetical protein F1559_002636 [Cyanidiococcus yangmingshanensis]|uniref:Uncharacterized protein n=1 Tax=Cyanidiococcus yangmingshanensis TaxID=2690220 RepID=A0A7J7INE7_9RHOD|nr:hypothetical protein F1559_002636 [Cyanidiococcus yangmingshanensis]
MIGFVGSVSCVGARTSSFSATGLSGNCRAKDATPKRAFHLRAAEEKAQSSGAGSSGASGSERATPSATTAAASAPAAAQSSAARMPAMTALKTAANRKLGEVTQARLRKVGDSVTPSFRQIESFRVPSFPIPGKDSEVARRTERMHEVMRQIFGYGHLFERDDVELDKLQSCYINGELNTKDFVRAVAKSETYKQKFWYNRPPFGRFGAVELAFKHLLGRRTFDAKESAAAQAVYHAKGYEAMIDYVIDNEYDRAFPFRNDGSDNMPQWREPTWYMGRRPEPQALRGGLERAMGGARGAMLYEYRIRLGSQNMGVVAGGSPPPVNLKNKTDEPVFRVITAGYREPAVNNGAPGYSVGRAYRRQNKFSSIARSQRTYLVPLSELNTTITRIHRSGGSIRTVERV